MNQLFKLNPGSATSGVDIINPASATDAAAPPRKRSPRISVVPTPNKNVESAVYAHIQAVRALGRTQINTVEIASALGLSPVAVEQTVAGLIKKGIKMVD